MALKRISHRREINIDWESIRRQVEQSGQAIEGLSETDRDKQECILSERAVALAKAAWRTEQATPSDDWIEVLVFQSAGESYAFETVYVDHVSPILPITTLPGVPSFVIGIVMSKGDVLSVIDLRSVLDLSLSSLGEPNSIIVLKGEAIEFGILVEAVSGVERYPKTSLEQRLPTLADIEKTYLKGVTPDRVAILDAHRLLSDPKMVVEAG